MFLTAFFQIRAVELVRRSHVQKARVRAVGRDHVRDEGLGRGAFGLERHLG